MRMHPGARGLRAVTVVAVLAAGAVGCADGGGGGGGVRKTAPKAAENGPKKKTAALIEKTNEVMAATSFRAAGTSTAFGGAEQEIWWDPASGLRMEVRAGNGTRGEMYCKDGTSYISAPLLAETLGQRGRKVTVPDAFAQTFVTVEATGEDCEAYFALPDSGKRVPAKDGEVGGRKTLAVAADGSETADVYHIAASGQSRVLKMDSEREGVRSTTTYAGYGKDYRVTLPPEDQRIKMAEFQKEVVGSAG